MWLNHADDTPVDPRRPMERAGSSRSLHVCLAGPASTGDLAEYLDGNLEGAPTGLGGTPLCALAGALVDQGHRVTVVSLDPSVSTPIGFRGPALSLHYGPLRARHSMRDGMLQERTAIRELIREARPDVVNAHWAYEYGLGALATGYPTVVTVHDWAPAILRYAPIPYWMARQVMYFACVRRAPWLTTVSPYLQRRLMSIVRRPVTMIPNGVAAGRFSAGNGDRPDGSVVLSLINGFTRMKNATTLLEAFAMVRDVLPGVRLRIAGPGFEDGGLANRWARPKGLDRKVEFLGPVPSKEVDVLLDDAALLVHPSKEESFGMTLVEAMARRTPIVAGRDSGGVPWVLGEGSAGALVDVRSAEGLAAGVIAVLSDEGLRRRYSEAGYCRARALFALDQVAAQYVSTFRHVVSAA